MHRRLSLQIGLNRIKFSSWGQGDLGWVEGQVVFLYVDWKGWEFSGNGPGWKGGGVWGNTGKHACFRERWFKRKERVEKACGPISAPHKIL